MSCIRTYQALCLGTSHLLDKEPSSEGQHSSQLTPGTTAASHRTTHMAKVALMGSVQAEDDDVGS